MEKKQLSQEQLDEIMALQKRLEEILGPGEELPSVVSKKLMEKDLKKPKRQLLRANEQVER